MSERDVLLPTHSITEPIDQNEDGANESELTWNSRYRGRWKRNLGEFLDSPGLHKTVITLIAIDASCVLADLAYSFLSPTCGPPEEEGSPAWLLVLSHISLAINASFLVEIPLSFWAFGTQFFNPFGPIPHASLHMFDALVILTTFISEVILKGKERELAGLFVFLRLWRLVKLVGGVAVGAGELEEETAKELAETKQELAKARDMVVQLEQENHLLKKRLHQLEYS